MATFRNDVIEIIPQKNAQGDYKILKVLKEDGIVMEKKVFGAAVSDFTAPGLYEVTNSKNAKGFWVVDSAKLLQAAQEGPQAPRSTVNSVPRPSAPLTPPRPSSRDIDTNRAILLQVCIKSAAEVYSGQGKANEDIIGLAKRFLEFAEKNLATGMDDVPF